MIGRKLTRIALFLGAALLAGIGWSLLERPHRDIGAEAARFKMVPEELVGKLAAGDSSSTAYLDAVESCTGSLNRTMGIGSC